MEIKQLKIEKITKGYNPRLNFELEELKKSIEDKGILNPLLVRPKNGEYEIVDGECRWRVAQVLKIKELPCQIRELSDEEATNISYLSNKQRNNLSVFEEARHFAFVRDSLGWSAQEIADEYKTSQGLIVQYWRIASLPESLSRLSELGQHRLYLLSQLLDQHELQTTYEKAYGAFTENKNGQKKYTPKPISEWSEKEKTEYEKELQKRQEEQAKIAVVTIENEWSVKRLEQEIKIIKHKFEARDTALLSSNEERVNQISKKITEGLKTIEDNLTEIETAGEQFDELNGMIGKTFLQSLNYDKRIALGSQIEELIKVCEKHTTTNEELLENLKDLEKKMEKVEEEA